MTMRLNISPSSNATGLRLKHLSRRVQQQTLLLQQRIKVAVVAV